MASKKYYWLKLDRNFFKRHDIKIVESMPNGKDYVLFYLKLLLESIDHEGELRFSDTIPYNEGMLSTITDTNIDIVRNAIKIFQELGMMEFYTDGTLYLSETAKMIGCETSVAERVRNHRKNKELQCNSIVTNSNIEIETEKEIDKELEIETDKKVPVPYQEIVESFNRICKSLSNVITLSDKRKEKVKTRYQELGSIDAFEGLFFMVEQSDFLKGKAGGWKCTFDWLMMNDTNYLKVLEGQYANNAKEQKSSNPFKEMLRKEMEDEQATGALLIDNSKG